MKKIITSLGTIVSTAAIVATVSCGTTPQGQVVSDKATQVGVNPGATQKEEVKLTPQKVTHSWDFLSQDKIHFESMLKASDMKKDLNITDINNYQDDNKMIINELVTSENVSDKGHLTSVKGALFKYGTKSDMLISRESNGFARPEKITSMTGADEYDYVSNFAAHTLAEGGNIGMDLVMKNGEIYNVPGNSLLPSDNRYSTLYTRYRPLVYVDKNNIPHIIDGVDTDNVASLNLNINGKELSAVERKGNVVRDGVFGKQVGESEIGEYNIPKIEDALKTKDAVIYDTYFHSEYQTLDLSNFNAYEVQANNNINGITTFNTNGFISVPTILQAPYQGKVTRVLTDAEKKNYVTKNGISLVITKKTKILNKNDNVKTKYEINPKYSELKDAKWATTSITFSGTNWVEQKYDKEFGTNVFRQANYKPSPISHEIVGGGNHIIKHGEAFTFAPSTSTLNRTLFVMDTKRKMYGTITISGAKGSGAMDTNLIPAYLMSLGIDEAVHFDGGGSTESFERMSSDDFTPFQTSIDSQGWRSLLSAFAIGGLDD